MGIILVEWRLWKKSDFFLELDVNSDDNLTYEEWMKYYGRHRHSLDKCSRKDFYLGDCDGNDQLSWTEYRNVRMKGIDCPGVIVFPKIPDGYAISPVYSDKQIEKFQNIEDLLKEKYNLN